MARQLKQQKILIVEDCAAIADSLAVLLDEYGVIEIAYNGYQALIKVAFNYYDAVISDINMPVMDGIEFYKAAVENDPAIKDRFMFYTSSFETEHINFFTDNDVPFLFKPAPVDEIESMVRELLDKSIEVTVIENNML